MDPGKIKQVMEKGKEARKREEYAVSAQYIRILRKWAKEDLELTFRTADTFPVNIYRVYSCYLSRANGTFLSKNGIEGINSNFVELIESILEEYNKESSTNARYELHVENTDGPVPIYRVLLKE